MSKSYEMSQNAITVQELLKGVESSKEVDAMRELANDVQILANENKELRELLIRCHIRLSDYISNIRDLLSEDADELMDKIEHHLKSKKQ